MEKRIDKSTLRDAMAPLPTIWCITPHGRPRRIPYGAGVNNGVIKIEDGEPALRKKAERKGWRLMQPLCTADEWAVWEEYNRQSDASGNRIEKLPEELMPKCLVEAKKKPRRATFDPSSVKEFAAKLAGKGASKAKS